MDDYPLIADHGLIGDLQTTALVSAHGAIDWWCAPRFDSPSLFASLLDRERGGHCLLTARAARYGQATVRQLYLPDTAVLVTRFMTPDGVGEVADFMRPDDGRIAADSHRIVRLIRVVRGSLEFEFDCQPRFDYGRGAHDLTVLDERSALFQDSQLQLAVQATKPITMRPDGGDVGARFTLGAGQVAGVALTSAPAGTPPPAPLTPAEVRADIEATRSFWHAWLRTSSYRGRWQQMVNRSAITLKLLTYAPTGAPIAAATMGLPEELGGERNWDYRYTWVRDAALSVRALIDLGFAEEAYAFRRWMRERLIAPHTVSGEPLQIMYRVDGDPSLSEQILDHLEGYRGSAPVRAGNAAAGQIQLDIYGEAAYAFAQAGDIGSIKGWQAFAGLLDWLAGAWDRPDEGIWETRGGRRDFTYSRLMSWVAFDRGLRLAVKHARPADLGRWSAARDAIFHQIVERGWNAERRTFVQQYGGEATDASLLLMPRVGFISPHDPAWQSTLDAIGADLVADSLVYRYNPASSPDGLAGGEGTFNLCTFLYVQALAESGRLDEARYAFDKMLTYANHVGLFAEEIGPSGEQLGNFPQAFTHLALILAALTLDERLDAARR